VFGLLKKEKFTREPLRERNWVGAFMIQRLVIAVFRDALLYGALSWNITISWLPLSPPAWKI
jgi:hypothetical protein